MDKMALYVEGYTELEFASRLVEQIAGPGKVVVHRQQHKGKATKPTIREMDITPPVLSADMKYLLIVDCRGGSKTVRSRMEESYKTQTTSGGFGRIACLLDVHPKTHAQIPEFKRGLEYRMVTKPLKVPFILTVMEVEAWFLSEHTHFAKIDPKITIDKIIAKMGFDPSADDMTLRLNPSKDLNECYQIAGKRYEKCNCADTIKALDFERLYLDVRPKHPSLDELCSELEGFIFAQNATAVPKPHLSSGGRTERRRYKLACQTGEFPWEPRPLPGRD